VLTSDKDLFAEGEEPKGNMIESPPRKEKLPKSLREDDLGQSKRSEQYSHLGEFEEEKKEM